MASRYGAIALTAWWPAAAVACLWVATTGGVGAALPQSVRDGSSLCLLWFIPGASWTMNLKERSLNLRVLATIIISLVAAVLSAGPIVILGGGLLRQWLLVAMTAITLLGVVASQVRRHSGDQDWPRFMGEVGFGLAGLVVLILVVSVSGSSPDQ
jgi:hypothetical protein